MEKSYHLGATQKLRRNLPPTPSGDTEYGNRSGSFSMVLSLSAGGVGLTWLFISGVEV